MPLLQYSCIPVNYRHFYKWRLVSRRNIGISDIEKDASLNPPTSSGG